VQAWHSLIVLRLRLALRGFLRRPILRTARVVPRVFGDRLAAAVRSSVGDGRGRSTAAAVANILLMARPEVSRLQLSAGGVVVGTSGDIVGRFLRLFGVWEPAISSAIGEHLDRLAFERAHSGWVIDVGANIGYYSVLCSQHPGVEGVVSYEADPMIYERLEESMLLSGLSDRVIGRQVAVSSGAGTVEFFVAPSGNEGHGSLHADSSHRSSISVESVTLDADLATLGIDPRDVWLLKIDVEGAESEVLAGAGVTLSSMLPGAVVVLEVEDRFESESIFAQLPFTYSAVEVDNGYTTSWYVRRQASLARTDGRMDVILVKE
jgi:FkbM family methyltransferase